MTQLDKTFPTLDCAACILTPKMVDCRAEREDQHLSPTRGGSGQGLRRQLPCDDQEEGALCQRGRLHRLRPVHRKVPAEEGPERIQPRDGQPPRDLYPVCAGGAEGRDHRPELLHHAQNTASAACALRSARPARSITSRRTTIDRAEYGAIVVATGFNPIELVQFDEFAYAQSPDVVTQLEFERLMNAAGPTSGTLLRPSDGTHPKTHRLRAVRGLPLRRRAERGKPLLLARSAACTRRSTPCSAAKSIRIPTCTCSTSTCVPPARTLTSSTAAPSRNTACITSRAWSARSRPRDGKLKVQASDLLDNRQLHIDADMVVLAAAIEPDKSARPLATMLTASHGHERLLHRGAPQAAPGRKPDGRHLPVRHVPGSEGHPRDGRAGDRGGGKGHRPSVQGHALTCNPCVAQPNEMMCNGCSNCEKVCPYGAITYIDKEFRGPNRTTLIRRVAQVNPAVCQGCGACTVACPSGAMDLKGFSNRQIMAEVDAICR